jgi:hypothetical protein
MGRDQTNVLAGGPGRTENAPDVFEAVAPKQSRLWQGVKPMNWQTGKAYLANPVDLLTWANWVKTEVGVNAETSLVDGVPPTSTLVTAGAESDGHNMQWSKDAGTTVWENVRPASGRITVAEFSFKVSSALQSKGELGFAVTDTTINGGVTDGIYFRKKDGDATLFCVTEKNSTETENESTIDLVDDTYVTIGIKILGVSGVQFWINNALRFTHTTNIVDDEDIALSFALLAGSAAAMTSTFRRIAFYTEVF